MSRRIDPSRLAGLVSRPGIDPRVHLTFGIVDRVVVDPEQGVFVDVTLLPHEDNETAVLGVPYAGGGFGMYTPVQEDDTVLLAIPEGDCDYGPVIIARMWSSGDKPFSEMQGTPLTGQEAGQYEAAEKVILRCKPGTPYEIYVSEGANITIKVEGSGNANVIVDTGKVYLGDITGTEPAAKGTTLKSYLDNLKSWIDLHKHAYLNVMTPAITTPPATVPAGTPDPSPTVPAISATKVEVK